jgi:two-component system invasion response regulator UvrY
MSSYSHGSSGSCEAAMRMGKEPLAVVVTGFDPVLALGLAVVLDGDRRFRVVGSGLGDAALLRDAVTMAPDVVIVNESVARAALGGVRALRPAVGILVFAHEPTPRYGMRMLAAGASCVGRGATPSELLGAVQIVASGGRIFAWGEGERIERHFPQDAPPLTRRQLEVLERLSEGKSHKQIAQDLRIGVRTVHTYTAQLCDKLGARGKRELIGMPLPGEPAALGR